MRILQSRILFHEKNRRNIPMQKIAFHLNSLQQGGAERVVSNLANRFAKEGYEVVIATEWYGTDEFALDQKVRRVHVGLTKEDENRSRISKMLRRIWYLHHFCIIIASCRVDGEHPGCLSDSDNALSGQLPVDVTGEGA